MPFTSEELDMLATLEQRAIASIGAQLSSALTLQEKQLIGMAVSWTYATLKAERS